MKSTAQNTIGILKDAFADALAQLDKQEVLTIDRRTFAKQFGKQLKNARRKRQSPEQLIELYVDAAKTVDQLTDREVSHYRAELISVFNDLEPGWLLTKPRKSAPSSTVKSTATPVVTRRPTGNVRANETVQNSSMKNVRVMEDKPEVPNDTHDGMSRLQTRGDAHQSESSFKSAGVSKQDAQNFDEKFSEESDQTEEGEVS